MKRRVQARHTFVLDFDPMCRCGNHATHWLEVHAMGHCTEDRPTWVDPLCSSCIGRSVAHAANIVADGEEQCATCGLTLVTLSDIIVTLCPIS